MEVSAETSNKTGKLQAKQLIALFTFDFVRNIGNIRSCVI